MTGGELRRFVAAYNTLYKEMDEVYRTLARRFGLSDCAFWVLYVLRESDGPHTQAEVCETLSLPRQTVNSALKSMREAGLIELENAEGNRKNKYILLTAAGEALAARTADRVLEMECRAFGRFSAAEREEYLRLFGQHIAHLKRETAGDAL